MKGSKKSCVRERARGGRGGKQVFPKTERFLVDCLTCLPFIHVFGQREEEGGIESSVQAPIVPLLFAKFTSKNAGCPARDLYYL